MKCNVCGAEMDDNMKFCANCGNSVENTGAGPEAEPMPAAESAAVPEEPTPESPMPNVNDTSAAEPVPTATMQNPYAGTAEPNPATPNTGIPNTGMPNTGMPYDPMTNPIPPVGVQPPKKKKKVWLIVLLCLIPVILIIAVVVILFVYGINIGKNAAESAEDYWKAYTACDAEAMADMVPDDYWTYISDTYDLTEEEAVAGMELYLKDMEEQLGGNLTYDWSYNGVQAASGSSSDLDGVRDVVGDFGLELSKGVGISVDATVSGDTDSKDFDFAMWTVQIDGEWYNVSVMTDFDDVCTAGYADNAKYVVEYGDLIEKYWNGFSKGDGAALAEMLPPNYWDFLEEMYGCTREEAEGYLYQYLSENMSESFEDLSKLTITATITDVAEYDEDDMASMNDGLEEYGLAGDAMLDVYTDLVLDYDGETIDDSSYVTLTRLDGTWYVYDLMYYFTDACGTYGDASAMIE